MKKQIPNYQMSISAIKGASKNKPGPWCCLIVGGGKMD